jgi:hypothetical protein
MLCGFCFGQALPVACVVVRGPCSVAAVQHLIMYKAYVLTLPLCCALFHGVLQLAVLQTVSGSEAQSSSSSIPSDEVLAAAVSFPPGSVSKMEENIKAALNSDTKSISMLRTLKLYLERMGTDKQQVGRVV